MATLLIPLVAKTGEVVGHTIVDAEDFAEFSAYVWRLLSAGRGYAARSKTVDGKPQAILLHREILRMPPGRRYGDADHINGDTLDNRRSNLRAVTHAQNLQNQQKQRRPTSSRFRGVYWYRPKSYWRAEVRLNGKKIGVGHFDTELEAAQAVSEWRKLHMPYSNESVVSGVAQA